MLQSLGEDWPWGNRIDGCGVKTCKSLSMRGKGMQLFIFLPSTRKLSVSGEDGVVCGFIVVVPFFVFIIIYILVVGLTKPVRYDGDSSLSQKEYRI